MRDDCQPQTDDWLLYCEDQAEAMQAADIRTTRDEDEPNDN